MASATNDVAGDGTTTATVLTRAILVEGCKSVAAGMNPMDLRRGINLAVSRACLCAVCWTGLCFAQLPMPASRALGLRRLPAEQAPGAGRLLVQAAERQAHEHPPLYHCTIATPPAGGPCGG